MLGTIVRQIKDLVIVIERIESKREEDSPKGNAHHTHGCLSQFLSTVSSPRAPFTKKLGPLPACQPSPVHAPSFHTLVCTKPRELRATF